MPWKATCAMNERMQVLAEAVRGEGGIAALCRAYGISRKTGYKWLGRYAAEGVAGLTERSRAPQHHPQAVCATVEAWVLALRRAHPTWGPRKLRARLDQEHPELRRTGQLPAASTMGALLGRAGLVVPRRKRAHTPAWTAPLAHAAGPNAVWCIDYKGQFRTGDGERCYPLTLSDGYSRFLLRCQAYPGIDGEEVQALCVAVFREYGLPWAIRSDNGPPFASTGLAGLSRVSVWWLKLGITPERIEPGHPEQNGRHERLHRTLKAETAVSPFGPAPTLRAQQRAFDRFRTEYNHERPHEALDQCPPATAYTASPRPFPARVRDPEYPTATTVRRVRSNGEIRWQGERVYLSESLIGELVGLTPAGDEHERYWYVVFGPPPLPDDLLPMSPV